MCSTKSSIRTGQAPAKKKHTSKHCSVTNKDKTEPSHPCSCKANTQNQQRERKTKECLRPYFL
jgi:hypothetical protein